MGAEALAHHSDRSLAARRIDVSERASLRLVPEYRRNVKAHGGEPLVGPMAQLVISQGREERALACELHQLNGRDRSASGGQIEYVVRVNDLSRSRHARNTRERHPLDVTDDGDLHWEICSGFVSPSTKTPPTGARIRS